MRRSVRGPVHASLLASLALGACDCWRATHAVGGTASGLRAAGLVLQNNGGDDLAVDADGAFTFRQRLHAGDAYAVTVKAAPPGQVCAAAGASGTVGDADVVTVVVTCRSAPALYFAAGGPSGRVELWKTDGSAAGTVPVTDGAAASDWPRFLSVVGDTLYFGVSAPAATALWRTDGSREGTALVKEVGMRGPVVACGGRAFFAGPGAIWTTDGTAGGTAQVTASFEGDAIVLGCVGSTLLFSVDDGVHGREPWRTDGTAAGTALLRDVFPGTISGLWPRWTWPTPYGGAVYFVANDGDHGFELWRTDGTDTGTAMLSDLNPGAPSGAYLLQAPVALGGVLYFPGYDSPTATGPELFRTDGTAAGTFLVKAIVPGDVGSYPQGLAGAGETLFFAAMDAVNGFELWKTDGTAAGTVLVADVCPGACDSGPGELVAIPGGLLFTADDGVHGRELWRTDGTAAGTVLVKDLAEGALGSEPYQLTRLGDEVFFSARTGGGGGLELWKSDGTAAGTVPVPQVCSGGCLTLDGFTAY